MLGPLNTAFCLSFTLGMSDLAIVSSALQPSGDTTRKLARFWGRTLCSACGIELTVSGGEKVDWSQPVVVMANHQSYIDVPVLFAALPRIVGMLAKQELFHVPFFGAAMRALDCVPIDRENRRQSFQSLKDAASQIQNGKSLVIFPEGTRSQDGLIHPLKKGPFYLAELAGVPIVPVGICGTRDVLAKDSAVVRGGVVSVTIGEPIAPQEKRGADPREALRGLVYEALLRLTGLPAAA